MTLTIKNKLILIGGIVVIGLAILFTLGVVNSNKILDLQNMRAELKGIQISMMQLRRAEKDFLLRHNVRYVEQFTQRVTQFAQVLTKVEPLYSQYGLDMSQTAELAQTIQRYDGLFKEVVYITRVIGLSSENGLRYEFSKALKRLEQRAKNNTVRLQLAKIKVAQRDFLVDYEMKSEVEFKLAMSVLSSTDFNDSATPDDVSSADDLKRLSELFASLSSSIQKMGETESEGLRGEFRNQAHLVESKLLSIEGQLEPIIQQQSDRVRLYNLLIAIATCVLMVVILVKSFATFHRSFSYFVMFFYQCKREFQRIDPKKLGFSEFKSLAELANEMVEARKDAEIQLEEVKRQLKEQKGS